MSNPDYGIISRVIAGEKHAYSELVDRHKDRAMTLAMRMLKNRQDAEEAIQDAFVRAFNGLRRFEWKSSFSTWFYRIVFNVCSTMLAKRGGNEIEISMDETELASRFVLSPENGAPDLAVENAEFREIIQDEINRVPPAYGAILTLFFLQELSYEEIVHVTELPMGTVKTRLFRARLMLREAVLKRYEHGQRSSQSLREDPAKKERVQ